MSFDWLYGRTVTELPDGQWLVRPLLLEIDDVYDLAQRIRELLMQQGFQAKEISISYDLRDRAEPIDSYPEMLDLSAAARAGLSLYVVARSARDEMDMRTMDARVGFWSEGSRVHVSSYGARGPSMAPARLLGEQITQFLLKVGKPMIQWSLLAWIIPLIPGLIMLVASIVGLANGWTPTTAVFAFAATAGAIALGIHYARSIFKREIERPRGMRFREASREKRREALANHEQQVRTTWKTSLITIPSGIAIGLITAWLIYLANFN